MYKRQEIHDIRRKTKVLEAAKACGNITATCRRYGISRETFYKWKRRFEALGERGLINSKPCPQNPTIRVKADIEAKILELRVEHRLGPQRIVCYLERFHGMKVSSNGVRGVLIRNGLQRLSPEPPKKHPKPFKRYEKEVPGHHVQVDVKVVFFKDKNGARIKRFQYTAIDDATRARVLRIYDRQNQINSIDFINQVVDRFPFRIKYIRTDNGHEFKTLFHWHVHDLGMLHVYIKPFTPRLNGKVERSHLTDQREFYQIVHYTDDLDLKDKLQYWEDFYNFHRPHSALKGKTPYEVLREKMVQYGVSLPQP